MLGGTRVVVASVWASGRAGRGRVLPLGRALMCAPIEGDRFNAMGVVAASSANLHAGTLFEVVASERLCDAVLDDSDDDMPRARALVKAFLKTRLIIHDAGSSIYTPSA